MNAIANLAATPCADLGECPADLAVDALIDEAELSPKPALVDRRGNGAHADLHLGLMQASGAEPVAVFQENGRRRPAAWAHRCAPARRPGQLGRDGEAAMLRTTEGVNTHRGAIWALGLLVAAAASRTAPHAGRRSGRARRTHRPARRSGGRHRRQPRRARPSALLASAAPARRRVSLPPRSAPRPAAAWRQPRRRRWRAERQARCAAGDHERPRRYLRAAPRRPRRPRRDAGWRPRGACRRRQRQSRRASPPVRAGPPPAGAERFARRRRRPAGRLSFPRSPARRVRWVGWESLRWKP